MSSARSTAPATSLINRWPAQPGGLSADSPPTPTPTAPVDQFTRLRDADRFWYQTYLPPEMARMIERQTLAVILRRNTTLGDEIREPAFLAPVKTAPLRSVPGRR